MGVLLQVKERGEAQRGWGGAQELRSVQGYLSGPESHQVPELTYWSFTYIHMYMAL
jgi:hypothetical protein